MATAVDFDGRYIVPPDVTVVQRDDATVQIGTEMPRRALLVDAPDGAGAVLAALNGTVSAGEAVARADGDPLIWRSVLADLLAAGLLMPAHRDRPHPPHLTGERLSLIHRHGPATADQLLAARADALVVVEGTGPVADGLASLLAASGVGHVHQRRTGSPPRGRGGTTPDAGPRDRPSAWLAAPTVRVHRPAPQVAPSVVVLADPMPPDLARAAELVTTLIPHLAIRISQSRLIVGPLVLPGRSACLNCVERYRVQADPGWPTVARRLRREPVRPTALLAHAAAELSAGQVLDLLDGRHRPVTVGATVEREAGALQVRRRAWPVHPDCGCRLLSGQL